MGVALLTYMHGALLIPTNLKKTIDLVDLLYIIANKMECFCYTLGMLCWYL